MSSQLSWDDACEAIRGQFPPEQQEMAYTLACVVAEIIRDGIYDLQPEHRIMDVIDSLDSVKIFMALEKRGIMPDVNIHTSFDQLTFRELVETSRYD